MLFSLQVIISTEYRGGVMDWGVSVICELDARILSEPP